MKRRLLSMVLGATIAAGLLAGCGSFINGVIHGGFICGRHRREHG